MEAVVGNMSNNLSRETKVIKKEQMYDMTRRDEMEFEEPVKFINIRKVRNILKLIKVEVGEAQKWQNHENKRAETRRRCT